MKYRNAKYVNAEGWIDCEIDHPKYGWIPYTLNPDDTDMTINNSELLDAILDDGDVEPYVAPEPIDADVRQAAIVRAQRDELLKQNVDPIAGNALRWAGLDASTQAAWASYRQALLDVPQQDGFPHDVTWPTKP